MNQPTQATVFPDSDRIDFIEYNPNVDKLRVRFRTGETYQYSGVTQDEYDQFAAVTSENAGKFLAKHIKGKKTYAKVSGGDITWS